MPSCQCQIQTKRCLTHAHRNTSCKQGAWLPLSPWQARRDGLSPSEQSNLTGHAHTSRNTGAFTSCDTWRRTFQEASAHTHIFVCVRTNTCTVKKKKKLPTAVVHCEPSSVALAPVPCFAWLGRLEEFPWPHFETLGHYYPSLFFSTTCWTPCPLRSVCHAMLRESVETPLLKMTATHCSCTIRLWKQTISSYMSFLPFAPGQNFFWLAPALPVM